jgi:hypothetical protein
MHRRANGLLDPDRRDLAWSICRSVTSVVGLRSRLLCFALLARGLGFKSLLLVDSDGVDGVHDLAVPRREPNRGE